jgi:hypothetical protein
MSSCRHTEESGAGPALALIREFASAFRILFTEHARARMTLRHIGADDVREALLTATSCASQGKPKWAVVGGHDTDVDELTVIVLLLDGVVVVTAY